MFYFFKQLLKIFLLFINFIFLFFYIPLFLLKFFKEEKTFYLQHEGGFGHTITSPELLNYYFNNDWILIFAFSKRRHNKLIEKMYNGKLFFFNVELIKVFSVKINKILFNYIYIILKYLFKKKVFFFREYMKIRLSNAIKSNYVINSYDIVRGRYYNIANKTNNQTFSVPHYLGSKFNNVLEKNYGDFKSKILFILRYKDFKESKIRLRDSRSLEFYKDIILKLVSSNFQIIFQGDLIEYPDWIKNLGKSVIFKNKTGLSKDEYGIFAGMYSDIAIGPHSGGLMYSVSQKKKILILEHLFLGDALPNSIVSYPNVFFKSRLEFKDLMLDNSFSNINEYIKRYPLHKKLTKKEIEMISLDFIKNLDNKDYGIRPEQFGIKTGILIDCNAKFSPIWLKIVGF
jgi:hypothetical protein